MAHAALTHTTALDPTMKTSSALFAQVAIVLIGFGVLVLMLGETHLGVEARFQQRAFSCADAVQGA